LTSRQISARARKLEKKRRQMDFEKEGVTEEYEEEESVEEGRF